MELENEIVRRVVHHRDLLEYHLPLEHEIRGLESRPEHDVGDHVRGALEVLIQYASLIYGVLSRRIRVERTADSLERERNVFRAAPLSTLEHHMLEQVGHAHAFAGLVERCCAHPCSESNRPYSRHMLREYGQSVR